MSSPFLFVDNRTNVSTPSFILRRTSIIDRRRFVGQSLRKRREEEESSSLSRQHSYDEDEEEDALSVGTKAHSHSPGFATLPPLDTTFPRERTPYYSSAGFPSSSNTPPLSATTSASNQSLFTSYREPETPATPAFSPYEAPSKDFSGSGLRKSASYLDPSPLSTTATPLSRSTSGGTSLGAGPSSSRCNILPPARSSSPYRSSSPAGLRSSVGPSSGMSSLSLQQSAYGATLPSNQRTSPPRSSLGQSVRLPPARELMREADAIMMGPEAGAVPSRTRRPSFSSCWGR